MLTQIPQDPFSGIFIPKLAGWDKAISSPAADPVAVQVSRGDSVSFDPSVADGGSSPTPVNPGQSYPFDCTKNGSDVTVQYGTINSLAPYNINSTLNTGGSNNFYVLLSVTASNAQISLAGISISLNPANAISVTLGQPPTTFEVPIAICVSGTMFRTIGPGSLVATPYEVYRLAKAMVTPDALPFDSYYSWRLGLA